MRKLGWGLNFFLVFTIEQRRFKKTEKKKRKEKEKEKEKENLLFVFRFVSFCESIDQFLVEIFNAVLTGQTFRRWRKLLVLDLCIFFSFRLSFRLLFPLFFSLPFFGSVVWWDSIFCTYRDWTAITRLSPEGTLFTM